MAVFYQGKKPNNPSQISMLCNASYTYQVLFDTSVSMDTKKTDNVNTLLVSTLKKSLTKDYYSGTDINVLDLEEKNRTVVSYMMKGKG